MHKGFTFLEILFSLLLISLLLLGMDATLFTSLRQVKSNLYFTSAIQQLAVITERLKIMPAAELTETVKHWNEQNQHVLPQTTGWVEKKANAYSIVITWGGYKAKNCQKNIIGETGCLHASLSVK